MSAVSLTCIRGNLKFTHSLGRLPHGWGCWPSRHYHGLSRCMTRFWAQFHRHNFKYSTVFVEKMVFDFVLNTVPLAFCPGSDRFARIKIGILLRMVVWVQTRCFLLHCDVIGQRWPNLWSTAGCILDLHMSEGKARVSGGQKFSPDSRCCLLCVNSPEMKVWGWNLRNWRVPAIWEAFITLFFLYI